MTNIDDQELARVTGAAGPGLDWQILLKDGRRIGNFHSLGAARTGVPHVLITDQLAAERLQALL